MAQVPVIEKYGLERVANDLLAPGPDGAKRPISDVVRILTDKARAAARKLDPEMAPSLIDDIRVTKQALYRYMEKSKTAARRIIARNDRIATEAAEAQINGLGTLLRVRKELWAIYNGKIDKITDKDGKIDYGLVDTLDAQRILGRLESVGKGLLDLELLGQDPALFQRFLKVLDKGVEALFGPDAPDRLKEWLQDQDEFKDVAIALGWVNEDDEGAPPAAPEGGNGVVM